MSYDDDQLIAYLRGELDPRETAEIDRACEGDDTLMGRVQALATSEVAFGMLADQVAPRPWWRRVWETLPAGGTPVIVPLVLVPAMLVLFFLMQSPSQVGVYGTELAVGEQVFRGEDAPSVRVTHGSGLKLTLRPETSQEAVLTPLVAIDGAAVPVDVTRFEGGTLVVEAVFGESLPALSVGEHTLTVRLVDQGWLGETEVLRRSWALQWFE